METVFLYVQTGSDISIEIFREKKQTIENQIAELEQNNSISKQQIQENESEEEKKHRIESLQEFVNMKAFDPSAKIPESLIEAFVDKIVFDKGVFSWYLNPKFGNEVFDMDTTDWKKSMLNREKKRTMPHQLRKTTTAQ